MANSLAFPKPKDVKNPAPSVRVYRDGREQCNLMTAAGKREYKDRIRTMWIRQRGLCCLCKRPMGLCEATFEHERPRGMGGAFRDDRIELEGKPMNGAAHFHCNSAKGSKRITYNR